MATLPLLIHIGLVKTGSTWLQKNVFWKPESGFAPIWSFPSGEAVERFVLVHPRKFEPRKIRKDLQPLLDAAYAAGRVPVISHEVLAGEYVRRNYYGFEVARRLNEACPEARILICIREQTCLLLSLWREYVKGGGVWGLDRYVGFGEHKAGYRALCDLEQLEFDLLVHEYNVLFGQGRVLCLAIEQLRRSQESFVGMIYQFCGIPSKWKVTSPPENVGLGPLAIEFKRRFNMIAKGDPLGHCIPLGSRVAGKAARLLNLVTPRFMNVRLEQCHHRFIAQQVGDRFRDSNTRLAAMCGLPLHDLGYPCDPVQSGQSR